MHILCTQGKQDSKDLVTFKSIYWKKQTSNVCWRDMQINLIKTDKENPDTENTDFCLAKFLGVMVTISLWFIICITLVKLLAHVYQ